ncbi:MAG: anti-sigma factor family protein [Chthoniobacteraceae bacterium]
MKRSDFPADDGRADERFTAWLDGQLPEGERAEFEAELDAGTRERAEAERSEALKLGDLLRRHAMGPVRGCEGLNAQVLARIQAEIPVEVPSEMPAEVLPMAATGASKPLGRLVWGGFGGLAAAAVLFFAFVQPVLNRPGPPPEYYAQIFKATTADPTISAVAVHSEADQATVIWIDGLDYVPAQKN